MRSIALLAYDGIGAFHLAAPFTIFGEDWTHLGLPKFDLRLFVPTPGEIRCSLGSRLDVAAGPEAMAAADMIIIPSWAIDAGPAPEALLAGLRAAHARGAKIVGLCLGAFLLAEAGVLDGRSATTHWAYAANFANRFPQVSLDPQVLYIDHGDVATSAGTAAGLDCCLHLLRQSQGAELAARLARQLVIPPFRQGGQAQFVDNSIPSRESASSLSRTLEWAQSRLGQKLDVDLLAERAGMSRRSFTRHFRQTMGESLGDWLLRQRLAEAQKRLETTPASIEQIAYDCGFGSPLTLRLAFAKMLKTSPSRYRREFSA